jgi:glycogen debranching enzyme
VLADDLLFLDTNGRGAMLRAKANWGELGSRYDALLAANPDPHIPVNRQILLTRCRAWLVFQGYSQDISSDCLDGFGFDYHGGGWWRFQIPSGQGQSVRLTIRAAMDQDRNCTRLTVSRHPSGNRHDQLPDHRPVRLIIRPDIENRGFHELTKAFMGPEKAFPDAIHAEPDGFTFAPRDGCRLKVRMAGAVFKSEPEWHYMVHRPQEARRGQDPDSDLFSPGYFSLELTGGAQATLTAGADETSPDRPEPQALPPRRSMAPMDALKQAMAHYVVARGQLKSVIAGYPWFLDWGRDALIFTRGMIAAGMYRETVEVMRQFGRFEQDGTLPNMIVGDDAGNRDTADAPLWFMVACDDLLRAEGSRAFLDTTCGGRTIRDVLFSIGQRLMQGTPNGLQADPQSGLLYSPAHFTWMDTDHPAGTPRAGYPIEIQALWYAGLCLLAKISDSAEGQKWRQAAQTVRDALHTCYPLSGAGYLSDCLHAAPGTPARQAEPDDALRPNQLFAITMGAVDDPLLCRRVLAACGQLLVPGAIRSLADRPLKRPLPIVHHGQALNDPHHPYQGTYAGDEDRQRKPAYHNGTAWTWVFPSYCEAWALVYGAAARPTALAWLSSAIGLVNRGCVGHLPEILDGSAPHAQRGCDAQAWSASEVLRVWSLLSRRPSPGGN